MPDLTSTLLAMYQQIIGGSTAREQSSLEAACARRVILSGISISAAGNVVVGGNLVVGGTFAPATISTTTLTVTGAASVGTDLTVGGVLVCTTLNVSANAGMNNLTVVGGATVGANLGVTGTLTVTGLGPHTVTASGVGGVVLNVRNSLAGTGNFAQIGLGNDLGIVGFLAAYSSTFTPVNATQIANGIALQAAGPGGLTLNATTFVRVTTGGSVEKVRVLATGQVGINTPTALSNGRLSILADQAVNGNAVVIQNSSATNGIGYILFNNSVGGAAGFILQTGATTVSYTTSSDTRLKRDLGRVQDLSALRALPVHDFTWVADGVRDRGVFAQEAHALYPRAIAPGTDERTADGSLAKPWMTDYSKFVPDLIAGWQQHDAELAALRAHLSRGAAA